MATSLRSSFTAAVLLLLAAGPAAGQDVQHFSCIEGQTIVASVDRATSALRRDVAPPRSPGRLTLSIVADTSGGRGSLVPAAVELTGGQLDRSYPEASMEVGVSVAAAEGYWYFDLASRRLFIAEPFLGQGARFRRFTCLSD